MLLFRPGALMSQPELSAARLDGLLVEVGDAYMPPDLPENASARVACLLPLVSPGYALSGPTAAWVHGVGDRAPDRHDLQRVAQKRPRPRLLPRVVLHERRLEDREIVIISGVPVTTMECTLTDLALAAGRDPLAAQWMRRVADAAPECLPRVRAAIESRSRLPGKHAALAALRDLRQSDDVGYDDVTR